MSRGLGDVYKRQLHNPEAVTENEKVKILWDFEVRTDRRIHHRRPDIVIVDKENKQVTIIDVAIPSDNNIKEKEIEKITKYQDLKLEVQKLWKIKAKVVPVVIGGLGATSKEIGKHLANIPGKHSVAPLLKAALLGSTHILRRVLDLPGFW